MFWNRLGGRSGRLGGVLEASLGLLGASWGRLGPSWRRPGGVLGLLEVAKKAWPAGSVDARGLVEGLY